MPNIRIKNCQVYDASGKLIDSWVTDGTSHKLQEVLKADETYILSETNPPAGYYKTESIPFHVSKDGSIDRVVMKDEPTKIYLEKRGILSDGKTDCGILSGAHIQIKDESGKIVYQFYTDGTVHEITGILESGKSYTAEEIEAPNGYQLAAPVAFTVSEDGTPITIKMMDQQKPSSPDHPKPKLILKKYDGITFNGLADAEFTIYRSDGSKYLTVRTHDNGQAEITKPAKGTYTFKETKAPEGYLLSTEIYTFTVSDEVSGTLAVPNYPKSEVPIVKEDLDSGKRLMGAELAVYDEAGNLVERGITDENGVWNFKPLAEGSYRIIETKAPAGYRLANSQLLVKVTKKGEISGQTTIYNEKLERKVGRITALYRNGSNTDGWAWLKNNGNWLFRLPKTGDDSSRLLLYLSMFSVMLGSGYFLWKELRKRHGKRKEK